MNTVRLEKVKIGLQIAVSEILLDTAVDVEHMLKDQVVFQIRGHVWGESLPPKEIRHPRDWWQAVKERWAPAWAKRRWPVVYTVHTIDVKALYPNYRVQLPREKHSLTVAVWDREETLWKPGMENDTI